MSDRREPHEPSDAFHAHLDGCEQCREHPFDLCEVGQTLIARAGHDLAKSVGLDFDKDSPK